MWAAPPREYHPTPLPLLYVVGPPLGMVPSTKEDTMGATRQPGFNQDVARALVESGAIDLEKMTDVYKTFAQDALIRGDDLVLAVGKYVMINCGWPGPLVRQFTIDAEGAVG
jgi:hypothetical protein